MTKLEMYQRTREVLLELIPAEPESISQADLWRLVQQHIHRLSFRERQSLSWWIKQLIRKHLVVGVYPHRYARIDGTRNTEISSQARQASENIRNQWGS